MPAPKLICAVAVHIDKRLVLLYSMSGKNTHWLFDGSPRHCLEFVMCLLVMKYYHDNTGNMFHLENLGACYINIYDKRESMKG